MNQPTSASRRAFLRTSTLAALASTGLSARAARGDFGIDAHVHIWTPDTQRYPLGTGFTKEKDMVPSSFTPEELFAQCRPQHVGRVVLVQMNFYTFDNRYLLDAISQYPGTFSGVAILDETLPDAFETMKRLASQGVRGFRLYGWKDQVEAWSESAAMKALWSHAGDAGLSMCLLTEPGALPAIRRMAQAFPKTRVVIDHFARLGMAGPVQAAELELLCRLAELPHTYVKTSAFYALGAKKAPYTDLAPLIRSLRDSYGADRLMWGSDCPYQVQDGHTYRDSLALIRDRLDFLSADEKQAILSRTAEKVFFS